jgi:hypothetical protein
MHRSDLKELKMRPSTDEHDYQVRLRSAIKFLTKARSALPVVGAGLCTAICEFLLAQHCGQKPRP